MIKSTVLYVAMVVILVGGLWLVFHFGNALQTPPDVSGAWVVVQPTTQPGAQPNGFTILQSGKYIDLKPNSGKDMSLTLSQSQTTPQGNSLLFKGRGQTLSVIESVPTEGDEKPTYQFAFDGNFKAQWQAQRAK